MSTKKQSVWLPIRDCRCHTIDNTYKEFEINDSCSKKPKSGGIKIPQIEDSDLSGLKNKIICEYEDIISKLECGIQPDLEFLLEEISLVYLYDEIQEIL